MKISASRFLACSAAGAALLSAASTAARAEPRDEVTYLRGPYNTAFFKRHNDSFRYSSAFHYHHGKEQPGQQLSQLPLHRSFSKVVLTERNPLTRRFSMHRFTLKTATALSLGASLLTVATPQLMLAHNGVDHSKGKHVQHVTVTVTSSGYSPSTVSVKAGQEVHLTFVSKGSGCANGIRIPALKQSINLKKGQKKEIVFTPKKGQTIAFACSMKMFKGRVVAR